jgi:DNA-binding response OmpR family regulator
MRQRTVLLLENEPVIALDLREELEAGGCRVIAAEDAQDAVQLSMQHDLDLAILNFRLQNPDDGMALARRMRLCPHTKLLFVTGANPQDLMPPVGLKAEYQVLHKPFARRQLHAVLLP